MSHYGSINGEEASSANAASGLLRVAASVYRVSPNEVSDLLTKIRGTYRILDQLRIEKRVPDMFDLPPSWVVNRWLAAQGYDTSDHLGSGRVGEYEEVWHACRARFPRFGIVGAAGAADDSDIDLPGSASAPKKACPCRGCVVC